MWLGSCLRRALRSNARTQPRLEQVIAQPDRLERGHAAQNFAAEVSGDPDGSQLPRLGIQIDLVRAERASTAIGNESRAVDELTVLCKELRADPQGVVLEPAGVRHASSNSHVQGFSLNSGERVADRIAS